MSTNQMTEKDESDIQVKFLHPIDSGIITVTLDGNMTSDEVISELILNDFIYSTPQNYRLSIMGGEILTKNRTLHDDGVKDGDVIHIIPNTDCGGDNYVRKDTQVVISDVEKENHVVSAIPGFQKKTTDKFTIKDIQNSPSTLLMIIDLYDDLKIRYERQERELKIETLRSHSRFIASLLLLISQFILAIGINLLTSGNLKIAVPILVGGGIQAFLAVYLTFRKLE